MVMEVLNVNYHDHHVGAASFDPDTGLGAFEYTPTFVKTGIELSPLKMPLSRQIEAWMTASWAGRLFCHVKGFLTWPYRPSSRTSGRVGLLPPGAAAGCQWCAACCPAHARPWRGQRRRHHRH